MMFEEYQDRVGELITGIIQQSDNRYTLVQLRERVEALLPRSEQVWNERYDHGMRVKAVITEVSAEGKGPSIVVSRRSPELIKELFELEVPEIADDLVEIVGVAREPGYRSKIAVVSHADGVDPVGACVGPRGSRVRMVVSELRGEKIDIIPYNDEPARFVAKALSPARVREVLVDDENKQATVIVPDDQLSLAIGREGQNARLAAKLTGWRVDIKSETEFSRGGRARATRRARRSTAAAPRCSRPAAVARTRRCRARATAACPQHQALARFEHQPGDRARRRSRARDRRARRCRRARRARSPRSSRSAEAAWSRRREAEEAAEPRTPRPSEAAEDPRRRPTSRPRTAPRSAEEAEAEEARARGRGAAADAKPTASRSAVCQDARRAPTRPTARAEAAASACRSRPRNPRLRPRIPRHEEARP